MQLKDAYKYCPHCGVSGQVDSVRLHCPGCGLDTYFNPKPVQSLILINDQGEILFVVRAIDPQKGKLDFPGGFVEEGENFEQTSRREVQEELGIDIGKMEYLSSHVDTYDFQGIEYKVAGNTYIARLPAEVQLAPADDVAGYEFYKLQDIPTDKLAWKSMHEMIAQLKKRPSSS